MGKGGSKQNGEEPIRSGQIKILLLGPASSGKSTFKKQMLLMFGGGFTEEIRWAHKNPLTFFIAQGLGAMQEKGNPYEGEEGSKVEDILQFCDSAIVEKRLSPELVEMVVRMWKDEKVKQAFSEYSSEFHISRNISHFLDNIERLGGQEPPTDQDILFCDSRTSDPQEVEFQVDAMKVKLVDVGGSRGERKKWFQSFEGVDVVLYFASLGDYDQYLEEDDKTNRMEESLHLFRELVKNKQLLNATILLLLNQNDVFQKKVASTNVNCCLKEFTGSGYEESLDFIQKKFISKITAETPRPKSKKSPRPAELPHLKTRNFVMVTSTLDPTDIKKIALAALNPDDYFAQSSSGEWSRAKPSKKKR